MDKALQIVNMVLKITGVALAIAYIVVRYQIENQRIQSAYNSVDRDMKYVESLRD